MTQIYLDNAATTPMDEAVFEAMRPYFMEQFGNPSSIHGHGREVRSAIEKARKTIAEHLNCAPSEIFFTSGGTEADNLAITSAVDSYNYKHIITSEIEHHAVLHTVEALEQAGKVDVSYVNLTTNGHLDYDHLEQLIQKHAPALVTLMHGNNEIGNINDIAHIGELCKQHNCRFHTDTVQTIGHFSIDLNKLNIDSLAASAHKFHGPKGVGFIYINGENQIKPLIHGGGQERNMRGGTENVSGIIGLARAFEVAHKNLTAYKNHILELKNYCSEILRQHFPDVHFNGNCMDPENSLYTVLNIGIPNVEENDMLLFNLDINGISASGGSACSSGSSIGSHVLDALQVNPSFGTLRLSFSKFNTKEEIKFSVDKLAEICKIEA